MSSSLGCNACFGEKTPIHHQVDNISCLVFVTYLIRRLGSAWLYFLFCDLWVLLRLCSTEEAFGFVSKVAISGSLISEAIWIRLDWNWFTVCLTRFPRAVFNTYCFGCPPERPFMSPIRLFHISVNPIEDTGSLCMTDHVPLCRRQSPSSPCPLMPRPKRVASSAPRW